MSEPFLGEIRATGFAFAPVGWALCNGQLLSISSNTALFSLLGTTYGGDGRVTFGLPNLQGRAPVHAGTGAGLTPRNLGESGGEENHTLISGEMPAHNHGVAANNESSGSGRPGGGVPSVSGSNIYAATSDGSKMNPKMLGLSGGNQPHNNTEPYLCINFIIALQGIFPPRD